MTKKEESLPPSGKLGDVVLMDKKGLTRLLADFNSDVKSKNEVLPFIDRYFECLRRLNLGVK